MKTLKIISVLLMLGWMGLIFSLSAQPAAVSSQTSGGLIRTAVSLLYPHFDGLSATEQEALVSSLQFMVRKTAHATAYAVLGLLAFLSVMPRRRPILRFAGLAAGICLLYAVSDELHQLYVPGRSGELRDVAIDFLGSMVMIALCTGIYFIKREKEK